MGYVDKNANILLLFLIVVSSTGIVAATVYFQKNFETINKDYEAKIAELDRVSQELDAQKANLSAIQSELLLKENRETEFVSKYSEVKSAKDELESTQAQLQKRAEIAEADKISAYAAQQRAEAALGDAISDLRSAERDRDIYHTRANDAEAQVRSIQGSLNTFTQRLTACKNACSSAGGNCDSI